GQELFDGVFGADAVKTEEEYLAKVKEMIASQLVNDSNYRFTVDAEEALKASVGELELPNEFLKKWLLQQDENRNPDTIDEDYAQMIPSLQWQLIKEYVAKTKEVKVEESDVKAIAEMAARQQFAQYGMTNLPDDILAKYAEEILDNKEYRKNIVDRAVEDKLFAAIKECVTIEEKSVSTKEFNALFEAKA
ncbi:MAG: trigger factor, partial [Bacteroidales bacterium]